MNRFATIVLLVSCLLSCKTGRDTKVLRIALQPAALYGPIFVVKEKGWLEQELAPKGITVRWTFFESGPPENESFAAGEQDVGVMGDSPAIIARAAGQDTRIVGMAATGPQSLAVVIPKLSKVSSPAELKGKKVGVVKGSYAHHLLALVLEGAGLTLSDIQAINLGHAEIAAALQRGDLDAGAVWEPLLTKLQDEGTARVLQDGTGIKKGALVILATQSFASQNPELVTTVLRAYQRGHAFINAQPDEAAGLVSKDVRLSPDRLRKVLAKFDFDPELHPDDIEELLRTEAFMRSAGITKAAVDIHGFVDNRFASHIR